ncbi:IclR family transcriptional regulator C-terminal domain-containing protein [Antrihabitans sp. NCIMB 15449]|uniref:IclR family transcriptional regulator C-terminal domain-containing protein n=1 Tax=Antrihabitans spumae TaxID=3373370 RepID=A0ABW7JTR2_9NOCA
MWCSTGLWVGTRFPALVTCQGKVLLAALSAEKVLEVLAEPSRSGLPVDTLAPNQIDDILAETRERGWALADQDLAPGIRSIAVPVRDGRGVVRAAMNVARATVSPGRNALSLRLASYE